jgi:hypothetical protein
MSKDLEEVTRSINLYSDGEEIRFPLITSHYDPEARVSIVREIQ